MSRTRVIPWALGAFLLLSGCGQNKTQQRFVPVSYNFWYAALDTKTGQLCKTFKWKDEAYPDRQQGLPDCLDLYDRYPER